MISFLMTPPWLICNPRGRTQVTVFERCTDDFFVAFLVVVTEFIFIGGESVLDRQQMCSQILAVESSRSIITAGEPEFSNFTVNSASSAGPVIWLRWSAHQSGTSIRQSLVVASEAGR